MGVAASIEGFTLCRTWELAVRCVCLTVDDEVSFVYSFGLGCIVWGKECEIVVLPAKRLLLQSDKECILHPWMDILLWIT